MTIDATALTAALESHAATSGHFERVNGHEPNNPPGNGLTAAVWADSIRPVAAASGLAATSALVTFMVRIYAQAQQEPQDAIDPNVLAATDKLMGDFTGDFTLGGLVKQIDLLGQHGTPLGAQAGWLPFPDGGGLFRVMTITVPLVINDAWTQAE